MSVLNIEEISRSRSAQIGVLTRLQNEIKTLIIENEQKENLVRKKESYDRAWKKFVNVHEEYFNLLDTEYDKEKATESYNEQIQKKLKLDARVYDWLHESKSTVTSSRKTSSSKASSRLSRKKRKISAFPFTTRTIKKSRGTGI